MSRTEPVNDSDDPTGNGADPDQDAWLDQLRGALDSRPVAPETPDRNWTPQRVTDTTASGPGEPDKPAMSGAGSKAWPRSLVVRSTGGAELQNALEALDQRMAAIESLVGDAVRRPSEIPQRDDVEAFARDVADAVVARLGSAAASPFREFDQAVDLVAMGARLSRVAEQLDALVAQQRNLVTELADDRRRLVSEAVDEIRTLLFGQ